MKKILYLSLLILLAFQVSAKTYYISPTGSDSNSGTSKASPWQSIAKVNSLTFNPSDQILFEGGKNFTGSLAFTNSNWSGATSSMPITIGHYGTGRPTINSSSTTGFLVENNSGFILRGINFVGSGISANSAHGVNVDNSQSDNTKLDYVLIDSVTVSNYGGNGIFISSSKGTSGFNHVTLQNDTAHDCTGGIANGRGSAGIFVGTTGDGYGLGSTTPCFTNVLIQNCVAYNNTGKAGDNNWVGSGIFMAQFDKGAILNCKASKNGGNSTNAGGGPVGIWVADCIHYHIMGCESSLNKTGSFGADGGGFGIDGGSINGIVQDNYSHDNAGTGYQIYTYNDGIVTGLDSAVVRYNISLNDASNGNLNQANVMVGNDGGTITRVYIYNNTFYQTSATNPNFCFESSDLSGLTGGFFNNILYSNGNQLIRSNSNNPIRFKVTGNDYYSTGSFSLEWKGAAYTSFKKWQIATGLEKIGGVNIGKTVDPLLINPGKAGAINYKLQNISPIGAAGLNLNALYGINAGTQDYFLNAVPNSGGNYSIGAHQPTKFTGADVLN